MGAACTALAYTASKSNGKDPSWVGVMSSFYREVTTIVGSHRAGI